MPANCERSYWLHASLSFSARGYWAPNAKPAPVPTRKAITNAARLLSGPYGANRLYLIYHKEIPLDDAKAIFAQWREACPETVMVIPALVLIMYDEAKTPVFETDEELADLVSFLKTDVCQDRLALFDVYANRDQGNALDFLAREYADGLIRLGLQPGETIGSPFSSAVQDTWSGFCHGKANESDWLEPGFGAETLRGWVDARNAGPLPVAWDLIVVAWDYSATERGGYPGYDDAEKNMPLPPGRNRMAAQLIRETAKTTVFAGFSSDLTILEANSRSGPHDGPDSFYATLRRGEEYNGYYGETFGEVTAIYREARPREPEGDNVGKTRGKRNMNPSACPVETELNS